MMRRSILTTTLLLALAGALGACDSWPVSGTDPNNDPQRYPFPGSSSGIGRS